MSYYNSEKSITKVESFLQSLVNCKNDSISWTASDPISLAYQIRQALAIAKANPEKYPLYKDLKNQFKIKVKQNLVSAVRHVSIVELQEVLTAASFVKSVTSFEVTDIKEVLEVIGVLMANPNFEEYQFKDYTEITEKDLNTLYKWTSKNGYYIVSGTYVIITRKEPPENLAWTPKLRVI